VISNTTFLLLAEGTVPVEWPSLGTVVLQLFIIFLFVILNGFFVAAEFALVKVRESQLDEKIAGGSGVAVAGKRMLRNLNAYLSACQLGITLACLILGALGEKWLAGMIEPLFVSFNWQLSAVWVHGISWAIAIIALTFLQITLGEQVPKRLAIRRPVGTTLFSTIPLNLFFRIFALPIRMLNVASNWMLKLIFRVDPVNASGTIHTSDEIALLVEESEKVSEVTETERDILINALELNDYVVRDIMTPRSDVVCLDVNDAFEKNVAKAISSQHTRFPLVDGHLEESRGLVHVKDMLRLTREDNPDLMSIRRKLVEVPEMQAIDELLGNLKSQFSHLALAVDEFGNSVGIVTMEDIIEELVGEIRDEFDKEEQPEFKRIDDKNFVIEGIMSPRELPHYTELEIKDAEASTMGGYVTHLLGHLPEKGEKVRIENYEVTVTESDGRRIIEMKFEQRESEEEFPSRLRREVEESAENESS
jgi:CBS domain containing-hemolysin-like protein